MNLDFSRAWKASVHKFIHLFSKPFWDICYGPGTVLGTWDKFFVFSFFFDILNLKNIESTHFLQIVSNTSHVIWEHLMLIVHSKQQHS